MSEQLDLPPAYAPFENILGLLAQPLADVLRGQLLQFENLARGLEQREFARQGEFEGLGGLTHHGDIEHILQSELLLQSEAPLEFLRRLAESEMLYHDRIFADPGRRHIWRVMISVGPDILGHGRLVALASLFFLARIAARREADFHWCFLPREEGAVWFSELSVNAIKRFLRSAAFREANAEDCDAAREAWSAAFAEDGDEKAELADWLIGSSRNWGNEVPAILRQPNSLSFAMHAPVRGEPRQASVTIRRAHRELRRTNVELAPDAQCLTALQKPFPTPRRPGPGRQAGTSIPDMAGWEPLYLSMPTGHTRAIRMHEGLLVLAVEQEVTPDAAWFLPLAQDVHLAGIAIQHDTLFVLHHRTVLGEQRLVYHAFGLKPGRALTRTAAMSHAVPSEHLFRDRANYALPGIAVDGGAQFYSTTGQAYELSARGPQGSRFSAQYSVPRTLLSNGLHRVVGYVEDEKAILQVVRRGTRNPVSFFMPHLAEIPDRFHGLAWGGGEMGLAYALEPGRWQVVPPHLGQAGRSSSQYWFRVEPCEHVLHGASRNDGPHAVLWSDAAYGGEGVVEFVRFANGKRRRDRASLDLGEDAARIATLKRINSHFWAVACDGTGQPQDLIVYRHNKNSGKSRASRHSLEELRATAALLQFGEAD